MYKSYVLNGMRQYKQRNENHKKNKQKYFWDNDI